MTNGSEERRPSRSGSGPRPTPSPRRPSTGSSESPVRRSTTPASRVPSRTRAPEPEPEPAHEHRASTTRSQELIEILEKTGGKDRVKPILIGATLFFFVAAGLILFIALSTNSDRKKKAKEALEAADRAVASVERLMADAPTEFDNILAAVEKAKEPTKKFKGHRGKLEGFQARTIAAKEDFERRKRLNDLLDACKRDVTDHTKAAAVRSKLNELKIAAGGMPKEFGDTVKKLEQDLAMNVLKGAISEADEKANASNDAADKAAAYDVAVKTFRDHFKLKNPPKGDPTIDMYKDLIRKSDEAVEKLVTPEFEAKVESRDLLSPKERKIWGTSPGAKFDFQGRELVCDGVTVKDKKIQGVMSIDGWNLPFYDIIISFEFTIVNKGFDMLLRYRPDGTPFFQWSFRAGPGEAFEPNKAYRMTIKVIGSKVIFQEPDTPEKSDTLNLSVSRNGGIGFAIDNDAKFILSAFELKVLRSGQTAPK